MSRLIDVLIIGGGPAGLAGAIHLAEAGLDVVLCEQGRLPRNRPCGEGLMPTGVAHLDHLNTRPEVCHPFLGIRYLAPDGTVAVARFREGPGLGIRRDRLSAALVQRAGQLPNLEIHQGVRARPLNRTPQGVEVQVEDERLCSRLLIGADGRRSGVRRWAGLDGRPRRHWRWGARRHYALRPWSDHIEVYWSGRGVEAYITPTGPEEVNIGFLWTRDRVEGLEGGDALFDSLLAHFPTLQSRLRDVGPIDDVAVTGPLQNRASQPTADGVLLLGDAAGYADAITGEGLSLAFDQAHLLPALIASALSECAGLVSQSALASYERQWRALSRSNNQIVEAALLLSRFPSLCSWATRAFARDPELFPHFLSANMGLASPWEPAVLARAVSALARTAVRT